MQEVGGTERVASLVRFQQQPAELLQAIKTGQIASGTIVKATQQGYIVNFAGKNVLLHTTGFFEEGQEVQAEFIEQNGSWQLRLAKADAQPRLTTADKSPAVDRQVTALLARFGLEASSENSLAARALIHAGLPASRVLLESLALLLSGKTSLQAELVHLTELFRNVVLRLGASSFTDLLNEMLIALEKAIAAPTESDLSARLRSLLANSGILMESKMKTLLRAGTAANARQTIGEDLKFILLRLRSLIDTRSQELRQLLGGNALRDLELSLSNALKLVRGQQVQNLIGAELHQLFVQIPFLAAWGLENVRMHFFEEREASGGDSGSYAVAVEMSTSNLGRLRVVLRWHRTKLYCHFTAEREPIAELLRAELPRLKERLEAGHLSVGGITCSVGASEDTSDSDVPWNLPFLRTVDVKV